jgi:hypothetical protein
MHLTYGAPAKKTASITLRQYNVEPPGLPLEITSAQVFRWYINKIAHCGTSSLSGNMLVRFVVSATGVAVAWL